MTAPPANPPARILLVRLSALGDVINTLPTLEALRRAFPAAHLGYAVEERNRDVIVGHPALDRVHVLERKRWRARLASPSQWLELRRDAARFVAELRAERYDAVLDLQGNFKGALHALACGAPRRIGFARGFCKELNFLASNEHVTPPGATEKVHRVLKFLALAEHLGASASEPRFRLPDLAAARERMGRALGEARVVEYAALHPGASGKGALKRWPPERFGALAERLERECGLASLVTWGPGERELAESVVAASGGRARLAPATGSVLDLAALLERARLFVGGDTGPMHLASAVSTPSVALFGPKDPRTYGPFHARRRVVAHGEPGAGRMEDISVEAALEACRALLAQVRGGASGR
jgi:lipopolysaccharide heptosyltransferase I